MDRIYIAIALLLASCQADYKNTSISSDKKSSITELNNKGPGCVRSEGGYETNNYCITIINEEPPVDVAKEEQKSDMYIKNKNSKSIDKIISYAWEDNEHNMYGFKGKSKDKVYEIDWRKEKTHFRIWDASHKKLLEDELVIVGPEDILKDKSANP